MAKSEEPDNVDYMTTLVQVFTPPHISRLLHSPATSLSLNGHIANKISKMV